MAAGASSDLDSYQYLPDQRARDTAQLILKKKYNNLRKLCEQNCKCYTGPHSVLQIFIEKIVSAIDSFSKKLRILTKDDLQLWVEAEKPEASEEEEKNLNELNYSINGVDLNLIFKMQSGFKPTSPEESEESKDREVQQKLKQIEEKTQSAEAKEKLR